MPKTKDIHIAMSVLIESFKKRERATLYALRAYTCACARALSLSLFLSFSRKIPQSTS